MACYSQYLGRKVTVEYRAGDVVLPASGTFVADSGRSIFLEQHLESRGKTTYFRWEIPYQYIHRLEEAPAEETSVAVEAKADKKVQTRAAAAGAARAIASTDAVLMPLRPRQKTA